MKLDPQDQEEVQCPNYMPPHPSRNLCHLCFWQVIIEVNKAAPPLKVPVLALASGENTKPEVRLCPERKGKSWMNNGGTSGNNGTLKCHSRWILLVAINGSMQAYMHMHYVHLCTMFTHVFLCFPFCVLSATLEIVELNSGWFRWIPLTNVRTGDCQTSGVPCVAQWSHFWGHWHHTPCITLVHQCQIQSLCNRRRKSIDEGRFRYQPAMQGAWTYWWSMLKSDVNKHICKLQAWYSWIALIFGH